MVKRIEAADNLARQLGLSAGLQPVRGHQIGSKCYGGVLKGESRPALGLSQSCGRAPG